MCELAGEKKQPKRKSLKNQKRKSPFNFGQSKKRREPNDVFTSKKMSVDVHKKSESCVNIPLDLFTVALHKLQLKKVIGVKFNQLQP